MIDIHCHILPGIDDGSRNLEQSIQMAEQAVADGIESIICTPHWILGLYDNRLVQIQDSVHKLSSALRAKDIPLQIFTGSELRMDPCIIENLQQGNLASLADSKYILLEFAAQQLPPQAEILLWKVVQAGYTPIIAHPERQQELAESPEILEGWVNMGVLMQVTASSIMGRFGKIAQDISHTLIKHGLAHFVASDAHGLRSRRPVLSVAYKEIVNMVGTEQARLLFYHNPLAVLNNQELDIEDFQPLIFSGSYEHGYKKNKGFWGKLVDGLLGRF